MTSAGGALYEATFYVERDCIDEFDRWLEDQAEQSRGEHGIVDVRVFEVADDDRGRAGRICQYRCGDDAAIDALLDEHFADIDANVAERFGTAVDTLGRTLREDSHLDVPSVESPDCLNCGTRLRGQYCGSCGQRARNRLISLWELLSEAFGDLFEFDSRLWRTLIPLLIRPGRLTRDYLEGRRARYMPPFRTYLVLSVIFFVVAFFDPRDDLGLLFEPLPEQAAEEQADSGAEREEILRDLAEDGIVIGDQLDEEQAEAVREQVEDALQEGGSGLNVQIDGEDGECDIDAGDIEDLPAWLQRRLTEERLERVCERVTADKGRAFLDLLTDNIPVALIVLLPLMALVLKILYPLSRRYFVEHLLFFVHYHAFFFLILTLQILFARITALISLPEVITVLALVAASFYIPVYLYLAMRRVYGQGHILTTVKYVGLVVSYGIGIALTMLGAVLSALVSV
ncbi:MAG: DUF4286 family protein [Gammaproteobacteria bacterium]|nr:DUF4286 family protein [Gammaproteobacteria bacterium]